MYKYVSSFYIYTVTPIPIKYGMAAENLPGEVSDTQHSQIFNVSILKHFGNPPTVISLLSENYLFQRKEAFWVCNKLRDTNKQTNKHISLVLSVCLL
jgi:hypothetical protein